MPGDTQFPVEIRVAVEHLCDELGRILWLEAPLKWPEIKALRNKVRGMLTEASHRPNPAPLTIDAALAALDVEPTHHTDRMVTTYDILGLDAVRAAHRAEVERAVADKEEAEGANILNRNAVRALSARVAKLEAEQSEARNRAARLEAALREIAARGPKDDPCAAEYDADGKRWSEVGGEATWCTYTSDESQEESAHASDVAAYAAAKIARAALEEPCKGDSPEAAEEDKP